MISAKFVILVLAGGQGKRMGGADKGLALFKGKPMIEHTLEKLETLSQNIVISCNRNLEKYALYGYPLIKDIDFKSLPNFAGPLLGIFSALDSVQCDQMLVLPCDTPFLSIGLINKLADTHEQSRNKITCAMIKGRLQPLHMVLSSDLKEDIKDNLLAQQFSAKVWLKRHDFKTIDFTQHAHYFDNINYPVKSKNASSPAR